MESVFSIHPPGDRPMGCQKQHKVSLSSQTMQNSLSKGGMTINIDEKFDMDELRVNITRNLPEKRLQPSHPKTASD